MNNFAPAQHDIDHDYNHVQQLQMDRDYTGMESDARMRMIQNEFELIATEQIGKKQIEDGQIKMYKGKLNSQQTQSQSPGHRSLQPKSSWHASTRNHVSKRSMNVHAR